jgi:hypothetical protein
MFGERRTSKYIFSHCLLGGKVVIKFIHAERQIYMYNNRLILRSLVSLPTLFRIESSVSLSLYSWLLRGGGLYSSRLIEQTPGSTVAIHHAAGHSR